MTHVAASSLNELQRPDDRREKVAARFEVPVLLAALGSIPVIVLEQSAAGDPLKTLATLLNWLVWLTFAAELTTMLAVVPDRRAWLREHPLEVAIVVLTPPFLPASLQVLRVFRLLRLLPLVRIAAISPRFLPSDGVRYAGLLALLVALGGGAAFTTAEGREVSTWDGLWWSVTTMTTVGYGDIVPHTTLGRIIAIAVMCAGIGFIAVLTAALAERLVRRRVVEETAVVLRDLDDAEDDVARELGEITRRLKSLEAQLRARSAPRPQ